MCNYCIYYLDEYYQTGCTECMNEDITDDELEKYYTNNEDGCPYFKDKFIKED